MSDGAISTPHVGSLDAGIAFHHGCAAGGGRGATMASQQARVEMRVATTNGGGEKREKGKRGMRRGVGGVSAKICRGEVYAKDKYFANFHVTSGPI